MLKPYLAAASLAAAAFLIGETCRGETAAGDAPPPEATGQPAPPASSGAVPDVRRGQKAFARYCAVCHGAHGEGGFGPNLQGVSKRLTPDQIRQQVMTPRGSMPHLYPSPVSDETLSELQAFLSRLS